MPQHRYNRHAWRCAYQIQQTLRLTQQTVLQDQARWIQPVLEQVPQIASSYAQLARAVGRSRYNTASRIVTQRIQRQLQMTARDMQVLVDQLAGNTCPPIPKFRDVLGELEQLEGEFGDWGYHAPVNELFVTTEPIRLEGIDFAKGGLGRLCDASDRVR